MDGAPAPQSPHADDPGSKPREGGLKPEFFTDNTSTYVTAFAMGSTSKSPPCVLPRKMNANSRYPLLLLGRDLDSERLTKDVNKCLQVQVQE